MKQAFINARIFTGNEVLANRTILVDQAVITDGEYIIDIVDENKLPKGVEVIDLNGLSVAPGFVDLQVNGGGGVLFNDDPSVETIEKMFHAHRKFGTTGFLPTLITSSKDKMFQAIESCRECMEKKIHGVLGVHIEGPFINVEKKGIHSEHEIRTLTDQDVNEIIEKGKGVIKILTLAPELATRSQLEKLIANGIPLSAGHSNATYDQAMNAFDVGVNKVTHLFNAMSQLKGRGSGLVGATLDSPNIWAGIVTDGLHVHYSSIRIVKKLKQDRLFIVTDAMPPVGTDISSFMLDGRQIYIREGTCYSDDGTLGGAAIDMVSSVKNCVERVGIPLRETLRMASTYPAKAIEEDHRIGKLKKGYLADMVVFDYKFKVKAVICRGDYRILRV